MILSSRGFLTFSAFFCFLLSDALLAEEWNVGFRIIQVSDTAIHNDIEVAIWYPTQTEAREETVGVATLQIAKDAEPLSSSRGLILISHGFSGNFMGHNDTNYRSEIIDYRLFHLTPPGCTVGFGICLKLVSRRSYRSRCNDSPWVCVLKQATSAGSKVLLWTSNVWQIHIRSPAEACSTIIV